MFSQSYTLDHVQLAMPAGEEDRAREFYIGALGLEEISKPDELAKRGGAWFKGGRLQLHLGVDASFIPAKKAHPALQSTNYEHLLRHFSEIGVAVTIAPLPFDGRPHCYIEDPFGNRIEIIAY